MNKTSSGKAIALGRRLYKCQNVMTLGVQTCFSRYSEEAAALIRQAPKIFYPTIFYADIFDAIGKNIFPSLHNYKCEQDKIKQTAMLEVAGIPHPRTRVYYKKNPVDAIANDFDFPFIAKVPRGSARGTGVFLIQSREDLRRYCDSVHPAYIQQYLETDRDIRVVVIGDTVAHAYWRIGAPGEFRNNVAAGAAISLSPVPEAALDLALRAARTCGWNDVGLDIIQSDNRFYVIEANMKYGREGFARAGIDYYRMMSDKIENNEI